MRDGPREVGGHTLDISSTDKVFFPSDGITKGDLLDYYERTADLILPHLRDRPVALRRFPDGIDGEGWFQKQAAEHFPAWIRTVAVPLRGEDRSVDHVVVEDRATLLYLVDQGTIELHSWLSPAGDLEHPDQAIVDLDPPDGTDPALVRHAARHVRDLLEACGVSPRLKTSGSKGYHVHVALDGSAPFAEVRDTFRELARVLAARHPDQLTAEQRRARREGRVFVDVLRNAYGQTAVAPYTPRALPGAPVATPIGWDELGRVDPRRYTIQNLARRLGQKADPWTSSAPTVPSGALRRALSEMAPSEG